MADYARLIDAMEPVKGGLLGLSRKGLELSGHRFDKTVFGSVQDPAPQGQSYALHDVVFERCEVETGPFWLSQGWTLENVTVAKLKAWRIMFDARTALRGVTLTSLARAGRLEILPGIDTETRASRQFDTEGFALDISGYKGDLRIMGVNAEGITIDPERQYRLRLPRAEFSPREIEGLDPHSLMGIALSQMASMRVRDAVYALPPPRDEYREQELDSLAILTRAGIAF